jgi:hypothetical protein
MQTLPAPTRSVLWLIISLVALASLACGLFPRGRATPDAAAPPAAVTLVPAAPVEPEATATTVALSAEPGLVTAPAELAQSRPALHALGEVVQHGDLALAVLGWQTATGRPGAPAADQRFVLVDVLVVNRGAASRMFFSTAMSLRDADLREYPAEWGYFEPFDYTAFPLSADISPGEPARGWLAFAAPETGGDYVFALDAAPGGGDKVFVALGPQPAALAPPAELLAGNPAARRVGEVIRQGDMALAVLGWTPAEGRDDVRPQPGHQFLVVDVVVANTGAQAQTGHIPAFTPKLRDGAGYQYTTTGAYYADEAPGTLTMIGGLTLGQPVRGQFVYHVREGSGGYVFWVCSWVPCRRIAKPSYRLSSTSPTTSPNTPYLSSTIIT